MYFDTKSYLKSTHNYIVKYILSKAMKIIENNYQLKR